MASEVEIRCAYKISRMKTSQALRFLARYIEGDWKRVKLNPSKVQSLRVITRWCHFLNLKNYAHLQYKLREKFVSSI